MSTPPLPSPTYLTNLGIGYAIVLALGFLVLLSTLLLTSYICCRFSFPPPPAFSPNPIAAANSDGIILPRIVFVGEEDHEDDEESVIVVGLDRAVINSYPKFLFSKKVAAAAGSSSVSTICSICLCEYRDLEMLRMMPECRHYFHVTCIDAWLKLNGSCPVCRNSPLPTPISTPLSELVPLSQYDGDRRRRR
ncbi:RING-H2 finger protein ATL68 [Hibiscus syriacus]|uniref:RING-H2 finger protein ATL68 n=1 Tax=Hibiscus syriacus TaxID=106335 RepID=A0A6A3C2A5_HIBSY|nr:RING-H2 finger protein ATL67-like [Hibiscus syriacus]KAE8723290.1 RING-H2 finger protein ATL68 [Hibiscus syriacus]